MQTIILAGGKGTRLSPYTTVFPKPLMPIGDIPILEIIIRQLLHAGCNNIVLTVGHLKELIYAYFGNGSKWGLNIRYSEEDKPLGTAGPLRFVDNLEDNFLVMNGDVLTDIDYSDFFKFHLKNKAICSIATYQKKVNIDLGVLEVDSNDCIIKYTEKPTLNFDVSMGIYAFNQEILDYIPRGQYYEFPTLVQCLIKIKNKVKKYPFRGSWLDIGRPDDYSLAVESFELNKKTFLKDD